MIEQFLGSTYALVAAWILGPLAIFLIVRRRLRANAPAKAPARLRNPAATSPDSLEKTNPGLAAANPAGARREVTPGFRDLSWGQQPLPAMTLVHDEGEEKLYARPGEDLTLEGVALTSINYSYHRDRLQAVMIEMPLASSDTVFKALCSTWGLPRQPNPRQPKYFWLELLTGMDAMRAVFERSNVAEKASLVISSRYLAEVRERERSAASR